MLLKGNIKTSIKIINNFFFIIFIFLGCNNKDSEIKKIILTNTNDMEDTITFFYFHDKIEVIRTWKNKGIMSNIIDYWVKIDNEYYEDIDLITNDSITDFRKIMSLKESQYTYTLPSLVPIENKKVVVSIKKENEIFSYLSKTENFMGTKIYYDKDYNIIRYVRIYSKRDSTVYR